MVCSMMGLTHHETAKSKQPIKKISKIFFLKIFFLLGFTTDPEHCLLHASVVHILLHN